MVSLMEDMHKKRINDIVIEDKVLFSCSNDGSVKIFDLNSNKQIKKFQVNKEIFSLSK
jgi:WD40 repeat protein